MGAGRPMRMSWHDLLFAHAPVPVAALRAVVPAGLEVDTFDGAAWLGVVPFRMTRVGPRVLPPLPGLHAFPELNVRTYVTRDGRPGVWFFSLDAANRAAVWTARTFFHLPYFRAAMTCRADGDGIAYVSERTHAGAPAAAFRGRYRPVGDPYATRRGDLDHWLTERYCLYAARADGALRRVDIEHAPWPLQRAEAALEVNTMAAAAGFAFPLAAPLLHFARRIDVVSGLPVALP
ncbi:MAG: DUF2071 domain-containing protein [Planctomycetota bacterium]